MRRSEAYCICMKQLTLIFFNDTCLYSKILRTMKKVIFFIMWAFIALIPFESSAKTPDTSNAVRVAKAFCTAVYRNDMKTAKSYMTYEDARRAPQTIRGENLNDCMERFRKSSYKVVPNEYSDQIVTVRFYNPTQKYLSKQNRWFCCSIELVYTASGWKVSNYGY